MTLNIIYIYIYIYIFNTYQHYSIPIIVTLPIHQCDIWFKTFFTVIFYDKYGF